MKRLKLLTTLTSLLILTLLSMPVFAEDNNYNDRGFNLCNNCGRFPGIENLKILASDVNLKIVSKLDDLKKHLHRPSLISKDVSYLPHLKESKKGEVVFWYTILEF